MSIREEKAKKVEIFMQKIAKKIIIIKGINQYGVLSYMLDSMAKELANRGYNMQICEWNEIEQFKDKKWDACISCQAIDMTFDVNADKYITWLVDHPILLMERLLPQRSRANFYIGCVDQTHVEYLKTCMGFQRAFYLPHLAGQAEMEVREYDDRKIEVFFPASYVDVEVFEEEHKEWRTGAIKIVSDQAIEYLKNHNEKNVEQAIKEVLERMGEMGDDKFLGECMRGFGSYIDTFISRYYRQKIVKKLLDEGISLTVVGSAWEAFAQSYQGVGKLKILSEYMSYEEVLIKMANSKMVLHVFPWFKNGSHERLASALANGALCLTDENLYTKTFLKEDNAILYDRNKPEELAEKIRYYLEHEDEAEKIAQNGKMVAEKYMMTKNTVDILLHEIA